jgi:hypothetical protein
MNCDLWRWGGRKENDGKKHLSAIRLIQYLFLQKEIKVFEYKGRNDATKF